MNWKTDVSAPVVATVAASSNIYLCLVLHSLQPQQVTASKEVREVTHDLGLSPTQSRKSAVDSGTNSRLPTKTTVACGSVLCRGGRNQARKRSSWVVLANQTRGALPRNSSVLR